MLIWERWFNSQTRHTHTDAHTNKQTDTLEHKDIHPDTSHTERPKRNQASEEQSRFPVCERSSPMPYGETDEDADTHAQQHIRPCRVSTIIVAQICAPKLFFLFFSRTGEKLLAG